MPFSLLDYFTLLSAVIISKCSGTDVSAPIQPSALSMYPSFCSPKILSTDPRDKVGVKARKEGLRPPRMLAGKELSYLCWNVAEIQVGDWRS